MIMHPKGLSLDIFRTFSGLSWDVLRTFLGLTQDFLRTLSGLLRIFSGRSQDFLSTFSSLSKNFLRIFSVLSQDFPGLCAFPRLMFRTSSGLSHAFTRTFLKCSQDVICNYSNFLCNFSGLSHDFCMTFSELSQDFSKPSHDFLRTFWGLSQYFLRTFLGISQVFLRTFQEIQSLVLIALFHCTLTKEYTEQLPMRLMGKSLSQWCFKIIYCPTSGTPSGKELYSTVYPSSCPNTYTTFAVMSNYHLHFYFIYWLILQSSTKPGWLATSSSTDWWFSPDLSL